MSLAEMKADLPTACNVGTKRNSKGYKMSWNGYKLHIDAADGGLPVSCLLSSALPHDSPGRHPTGGNDPGTGDPLLRPDGSRL
ncbi:MAG: hypothetical protein DSZ28_00780 [Thiothrix sp.]|nr:MAG: hypothetical protein DSZ28_00780 [Thiothrix sp.]